MIRSVTVTAVFVLVMVADHRTFAQRSPASKRSSSRPLVPGFGVEADLPPVPGFGQRGHRIEKEDSARPSKSNSDDAQAAASSSPSSHSPLPASDAARRKPTSLLAQLIARKARRDQKKALAESQFARGDNNGEAALAGPPARDPSKTGDRKSYRVPSPKERLPEGLPDWFAQRDSDGDGQVMMAEYATTWPDEVVAEFIRFDLNDDGIITPKECLVAAADGAVRRAEGTVAPIETTAQVASRSAERPAKVSKRRAVFLKALFLAKRRRL